MHCLPFSLCHVRNNTCTNLIHQKNNHLSANKWRSLAFRWRFELKETFFAQSHNQHFLHDNNLSIFRNGIVRNIVGWVRLRGITMAQTAPSHRLDCCNTKNNLFQQCSSHSPPKRVITDPSSNSKAVLWVTSSALQVYFPKINSFRNKLGYAEVTYVCMCVSLWSLQRSPRFDSGTADTRK